MLAYYLSVYVACALFQGFITEKKKTFQRQKQGMPSWDSRWGDKEGRRGSEVLLDSLVFLLFPCQRAVLEHAQ